MSLCEDTLNEIRSWRQQYSENHIIIAGEFNGDLESSDVVTRYINNFLCNRLLTRCDYYAHIIFIYMCTVISSAVCQML